MSGDAWCIISKYSYVVASPPQILRADVTTGFSWRRAYNRRFAGSESPLRFMRGCSVALRPVLRGDRKPRARLHGPAFRLWLRFRGRLTRTFQCLEMGLGNSDAGEGVGHSRRAKPGNLCSAMHVTVRSRRISVRWDWSRPTFQAYCQSALRR